MAVTWQKKSKNNEYFFIYVLKMTSLKKERDSLMQKLQQEGPTDVQLRTRTLQRENAQVCSIDIQINYTLK